jgi:hypothetical protein
VTFFTEMGATHTVAVVMVKTDHDGTQAYIGTSHAEDDATAKLPNSIPLIEL